MDPASDPPVIGDVPLLLVDATKAVDRAPDDISIGLIILRGWQLHRLVPLPADFEAVSGYLVRVNYEFDVAPDVPPPSWAEVEFTFPDDVTVVDAVPRGVTRPDVARSYELDMHLNFVHRDGRSSWPAAALAAVEPRIDCFGPGGHQVRWRHTGSQSTAVPVGSHTGWLVLLTAPDREHLKVVASGRYHLDLDPDLGLVAADRHDAFTISLPAVASSAAAFASSVPADGSPRVFVSYSQETPAHKESVQRLVDLLRSCGADVRIDQDDLDERRNWADWTNAQIMRADYVLVIASSAYLAASENALPPDTGRGVRSEYTRLADLLHRNEARWTRKILPVVLPGRTVEEIPLLFLPGTADHYIIEDYTPAGADSLLQVLFHNRSGS
jgi:hypothetical protein